jgi:hypothetical protein
MRRLLAAGAAVLWCLALGAMPAQAQSPSESPAASASAVPQGPVHVTGTLDRTSSGMAGFVTSPFRAYDAIVLTNDERLGGCLILRPAGSTSDGTWGTVSISGGPGCPWGSPMPGSERTWTGEWFTTGSRPVAFDPDVQVSGAAIYPVESIWLRGHGLNDGLSAVLRIEDVTHVDGWIYPTPQPPAEP